MWLCQCDCGNKTVVNAYALERIRSCKSCGMKKEYALASFNYLYSQYRNRAKNTNKSFFLSKEQFRSITSMSCYFCGIEPRNKVKYTGKCKLYGDYIYNGVDRLDNSKGYIIKNCVPCCKDCNYAKGELTKDEFLNLVNRIYNFSINEK